MAIGIINIQYTYDPEAIVIGGAISEREGIIEDIRKRVIEILSKDEYAEVIPQIKKMCLWK